AFVTFTAFHIQLSHFYAADTLLTFALTAALLMAERTMRKATLANALLLGGMLGLALSFKFSAAPAFILIPAAHALRLLWPEGRFEGWRWPDAKALNEAISHAAVSVIAAGVVAVMLQPYLVIDFANYARQIAEQSTMVRGQADLPYTRQYANTTPYLYFLRNLVLWAYGLPLGVLIVAAWAYVTVRSAVHPRRADLLLLLWVWPYFLVTGGFYAKFMRYLLPIMPVLALFGAVAIADLRRWLAGQREQHLVARAAAARSEGVSGAQVMALARHDPRWVATARRLATPWLATGVGVLALVGGVGYTAAFMNVYVAEHPRVAASEWIYANIPAGSVLTHEHWDDVVPLPTEYNGIQPTPEEYRELEMPLYEADDGTKLNNIISALQQADYIVLSSNRLYGSIPRLPERYPITTRYYELLFAEKLGFNLERTFSTYPALGPWTIADDTADESFTVYDHPKVLIFHKTEQLSSAGLSALLLPAGSTPTTPPPMQVMSAGQQGANESGGTYSQLFDASDLINAMPVLWWALAVELLGLLALPLAVVAFRWLPDRGYLFAKPLGLLVLAWLQWIVVSLGILPSTRLTVALALLVFAVVASALAWLTRRELLAFWRQQRGLIRTSELLFWVAFLAFVGVRMLNPDLWHPARGGEKPMDFAFLLAAVKSESYPPYDPWFAGGYLNYYYFGQIIIATVIKLTGIIPSVAYNLAVPTLFAATLGGAFSAGYNLYSRLSQSGRRAIVAGLAAAGLVGLVGNLGGAGQVIGGLWQLSEVNVHSAVPGLDGLIGIVAGLFQVVAGKAYPFTSDWYWASTRVYPGASVNEFPFFTFLFADLHAHMIAIPYTLIAIGAAVNLAFGGGGLLGGKGGITNPHPYPLPGRERETESLPGREREIESLPESEGESWREPGRRSLWVGGVARWLVYGLVIGALFAINPWDFPTYVALLGFALLATWYRAGWHVPGLVSAVLQTVGLAVLGFILFLPFHQTFQSFYSGIDPSPEKSDLGQYLVINGLFVFVLISFVAYDLWRRHRRAGWWRTTGIFGRHWGRPGQLRRLYRRLVKRSDDRGVLGLYATLLALVAGLELHLLGLTTAGFLLVLLAATTWLALQRDRPVAETFLLGLLALGVGLGLFCEFFAIKGDIDRMNTVFKFYLQTWIVWGIASGVLLVLLFDRLAKVRSMWANGWQAGLGLVVAAVVVYPIVATPARILDRFDPLMGPTLDGEAYMQQATYVDEGRVLALGQDQAAIDWLKQNVTGSPVILEGWAPYYRWGARVSIYTGLPTVIGWDWHEKQQRWGYQYEVDRRVAEVNDAYSSPDPQKALAVLREYGVSYVYVGALETAYYPPAGLAKFDAMVGHELDLVYNAQGVKIYRVVA
ncbi:MAG: DUF2298 domain-containing protein, partial [Chloroflexota bacterium]